MRLVFGRTLLLLACVLMIVSSGFAGVVTYHNLPGNGTAVSSRYAGTNEVHVVPVNMASLNVPDGSDPSNLLERSLLGGLTFDGVNTDGPDPKSLLVLGLSLGLALNVFRTPRPGR